MPKAEQAYAWVDTLNNNIVVTAGYGWEPLDPLPETIVQVPITESDLAILATINPEVLSYQINPNIGEIMITYRNPGVVVSVEELQVALDSITDPAVKGALTLIASGARLQQE